MRNVTEGLPSSSLHRAAMLCLGSALCLALPGTSRPGVSSESFAETLVRAVYYEGVPYAAGSQVDEAGAAHLIEMLRNPAESKVHGPIVAVLGMCGQPGSYEALLAFSEQLGRGALDRSAFRAWRALPGAMGYLARRDQRALAWLIGQVREPGNTPVFGRHNLAQLRRRAAAHGLGTSGRSEAGVVLRELQNAPRRAATAERRADDKLQRSVAVALEVHARVVAREQARSLSR